MHSYVGNLPSGACFDASKDLADTEWIKIWLAELKRLNPNKIKTLLTPLALKENFTLLPRSIRLHIDHNKKLQQTSSKT